MKQKTYISTTSIHLSVEVQYKENDKRTCMFTGGGKYPILRRGKFTTSDPVMQEALESHPLFGKEFKLLHEENVNTGKEKVKELEAEKAKLQKELAQLRKEKADKKEQEPEEPKEVKFEEVEGVRNAQEARVYLNKHFKVSLNKMPNARAIRNAANKHKVNFIDWK